MEDASTLPIHELKTMGDRIQYARSERGLSIKDLARALGVADETLTAWECGRTGPRSNRLPIIAGTLSVSMRWLMSGEGEPWVEGNAPRENAINDEELLSELGALRRGIDNSIDRMAALETRLRTLLVRHGRDDEDL